MMEAEAFSPGHVTGFFQIHYAKDPLSTGSRGAGMCLSLGAKSIVKIEKSQANKIRVTIDGEESRAPVTRDAIRHLLGNERMSVDASTRNELPMAQGFGMSAAGALSASLALARLLGRDDHEAFEAAHLAEVKNRTGLGDVAAIWKAGVTVRKRPGLPPAGEVVQIDGRPEVVLAVLGKKVLTKTVLKNEAKRRAIDRCGGAKVDLLLKDPTLSKLMELSTEFAFETGLAQKRVRDAVNAASKLGMASMSMLGNSVFAVGDIDGLVRVLSDFGETWVCKVDTQGARIIAHS